MTDSPIVDEVLATPSAVRIGGRAVPAAARGRPPCPSSTRPPGRPSPRSAPAAGRRRRALAAATAALPAWAATPVAERAAALRAIADDIEALATRPDWAELITRETGKRLAESTAELGLTVTYFRVMADLVERQEEQRLTVVPRHEHRVARPAGRGRGRTHPVELPGLHPRPEDRTGARRGLPGAVQALGAGSAVVDGARRGVERHLPAGCWRPSSAPRPTSSPRGSRRRRCGRSRSPVRPGSGAWWPPSHAPRFLRTVMELGGCAPFLVLPDADPQAAAQTADGRQVPQQRPVLHRGQPDPGRPGGGRRVRRGVRRGHPRHARRRSPDPGTDIGPLAPAGTRRAWPPWSTRPSPGAPVPSRRTARSPSAGHYAAPTVLLDVPVDSRAMTGEIFGPVAPVHVYDDLDAALAVHHATGYGLAGYVCGTDLDARGRSPTGCAPASSGSTRPRRTRRGCRSAGSVTRGSATRAAGRAWRRSRPTSVVASRPVGADVMRLLIGQTGAPTAVVNASLRGFLEGAEGHEVLALRGGPDGLVDGRLTPVTLADVPPAGPTAAGPGSAPGAGRSPATTSTRRSRARRATRRRRRADRRQRHDGAVAGPHRAPSGPGCPCAPSASPRPSTTTWSASTTAPDSAPPRAT